MPHIQIILQKPISQRCRSPHVGQYNSMKKVHDFIWRRRIFLISLGKWIASRVTIENPTLALRANLPTSRLGEVNSHNSIIFGPIMHVLVLRNGYKLFCFCRFLKLSLRLVKPSTRAGPPRPCVSLNMFSLTFPILVPPLERHVGPVGKN